jgi:hypothetical protein
VRVLIVGVHPGIMERALAEVRGAGHQAVGSLVAHEPLEVLAGGDWDALAIGGGVDEPTRRRLHERAASLDPQPRVVDVFGPGTLLARLVGP